MIKFSWFLRFLKKIITGYFILAGVTGHIGLVLILIMYPNLVYQIENKATIFLDNNFSSQLNIEDEIASNFGAWKPLENTPIAPKKIQIGAKTYSDMQAAADELKPGETLELGPGVYTNSLIIRQNSVTVVGRGHVVFEGGVAEDKGAIVVKGNDVKLTNIECRGITVSDENGACVRLEGAKLTVNHVYFHNSQEGILTGEQADVVTVKDSRFELLGQSGRAHGIYANGGELHIEDSLFIAAVDEGHEIKSRAKYTEIVRSVVASLSSQDSRLIDIANGGFVSIRDSTLEKGPRSSNADTIGYGLEGMKYDKNFLELKNNIIILERSGANNLIHIENKQVIPIVSTNLIISNNETAYTDANIWYKSRKKANLEKYPYIPNIK